MTKADAALIDDEAIASCALLRARRPLARYDVLAAIVLTFKCVVLAGMYPDNMLVLGVAGGASVLVVLALGLASVWSVRARAWIGYDVLPLASMAQASTILVLPLPHNGAAELCKLERREGEDVRFFFQKRKFLFDAERGQFKALQYPVALPLDAYVASVGVRDEEHLSAQLARFGRNMFDIPLPRFGDLFLEHATAPFFVFQVFCVTLWLFDEYWMYSVMTLMMLVMFESTLVKRRLKHLENLRQMRVKPYDIHAYRAGSWTQVSTEDLVPGDVVSVVRQQDEAVVIPCDLLLLAGTCVLNEALLTGESKPQMKEPITTRLSEEDATLDIRDSHKNHMIWGGTKVVMHSEPRGAGRGRSGDGKGGRDSAVAVKRAPDRGCLGYVVRTGFGTSQGSLVRTILYSTDRLSANNAESLWFIFCLLCFAVVAAGYVLYYGLQDESRSRWRLALNVITILTSVVPPELPMELSLAVNTSLLQLMRYKIFCTEPFRIPLGGAVDVCCFDKTGTLTSDEFLFEGVAGLDPNDGTLITNGTDVPLEAQTVLGSCHTLVSLPDGEIIGDPLEKVAFDALRWSMTHSGRCSSAATRSSVDILHRFAFSSKLKRMSCIVQLVHDKPTSVWLVAKGAPEVMESRFVSVPAHYHRTHRFFSRRGCRILALGYRDLSPMDMAARANVTKSKRDAMEQQLTFAGFLVLQCPIKPASAVTAKVLNESSHRLVMITGDHTLTASFVAREVGIAQKVVAELKLPSQTNDGDSDDEAHQGHDHVADPRGVGIKGLHWETLEDEAVRLPFEPQELAEMCQTYDLCVSGPGLAFMRDEGLVDDAQFADLIERVSVFARTSPEQKELIITTLKDRGHTTLMCGDGTNDVGALKQAHVGVALLEIQKGGKKKEETKEPKAAEADKSKDKPKGKDKLAKLKSRQRSTTTAGTRPARQTRKQQIAAMQEKLRQMAEEDEAPTVRLGDASIASPFTSKTQDISAVEHIIRQGRCTLVTLLQVYRILALNCLVSAYSMSVLYMDGVKMGETQMTIMGMLLAVFFLFASRSKPVEKLSPQRPHTRVFTLPMFLTIVGQFSVHLYSLMLCVAWSKPHTPTDKDTKDPESDFKPNVLNTAVFLLSSASAVANFFANYQGRPFMLGIRENKAFFNALVATDVLLVVLALEISPGLNSFFELVAMPSMEFSTSLTLLIIADTVFAVGWAWLVDIVFAIRPKKK